MIIHFRTYEDYSLCGQLSDRLTDQPEHVTCVYCLVLLQSMERPWPCPACGKEDCLTDLEMCRDQVCYVCMLDEAIGMLDWIIDFLKGQDNVRRTRNL